MTRDWKIGLKNLDFYFKNLQEDQKSIFPVTICRLLFVVQFKIQVTDILFHILMVSFEF